MPNYQGMPSPFGNIAPQQPRPQMTMPTQPTTMAPAPPLQPPMPMAQTQPKPKVLLQSPDDPPRIATGPPPVPPPSAAKIELPTPEQLGLAPVKSADNGFDWNKVEQRLHTLRATGFQMNQLPDGGWKVVCILPTSRADQTHREEVTAATRVDAVRQALEQAEKWAGVR
jgi:hypothetical protein